MANGTLGKSFVFFLVTPFTVLVGGIFEGLEFLFGHAGAFVVAGLAFANFLTVDIGNLFAVSAFTVMAVAALQGFPMLGMRKNSRLGLFGLVDC